MKPIYSVEMTTQVKVLGNMTRKAVASERVKLDRTEDGVTVTEVTQKDGKKGVRSFWVPDDNIVCIEFFWEEEKDEAKGQKK